MNSMYQNNEETTESVTDFSKPTTKSPDKKIEDMARQIKQLQDSFIRMQEEINRLQRTIKNLNNTVNGVVSSISRK